METDSSIINYVGECGIGDYLCGHCEGNCRNDDDCAGDLVCETRAGFEAVIGCSGEGGPRDVHGKSVCVAPPPPAIQFDGMKKCKKRTPCENCVGHCRSDAQCAGELRCASRDTSGMQDVPGCTWNGSNYDKNQPHDFCK